MRYAILLTGMLVGLPLAAKAEDFTRRFAGFSIGANAGAAWSRMNYATDPNCRSGTAFSVFCSTAPDLSHINGPAVARSGTGKLSATGFAGGFQAGLNWQTGAFVFGGEGDIGLMRTRKSAAVTGSFPLSFLGDRYALTQSMSTDWLATLRGRLGLAVTPQLLVYATGGAAFTRVSMSSSYADNAIDNVFPGGTGSGRIDRTKAGWTAGGGLQWALDRNWSVKAEYLYADFGSVSMPVALSNTAAYTQTMQVSGDLSMHLARFGIDYRF